jgi:hypothetical protein
VAVLVKDQPRVTIDAGTALQLLVVAAGDTHCAGVDLASGGLLRTWSPRPAEERIRPYDVVEATVGDDVETVPDPAQPEAVALCGPPTPVARMGGRRCERLLRPLLHPPGQPLLGVTATAIPFWQRTPDHPSIALVEPVGDIVLRRHGAYLACQFEWQGHRRELPCLDRALAGWMDRTGRQRTSAGRGTRLVVSLTPPIDGRCHKVVEAVLRRP